MRSLIFILYFFVSFSVLGKEIYIKKIEFHGLKNCTKDILIEHITAKTITYDIDILNKLAKLSIFNKIKVHIKENVLKIIVNEKPKINTIKIYGDDKKLIYKLLNDQKIYNGKYLDISALHLFKNSIKEYYNIHKIYNFKINIKIEVNKNKNTAILKINFKKNSSYVIKDFFIFGNNDYSAKYLLSLTNMSKNSFIGYFNNSNIFSHIKLEKDIQKIKDHYIENGYMDSYIKSVKTFVNNNNNLVYILIDIHEGPRYIVSNITLKNNKENKLNNELKDIINIFIQKNDLFSQKKVSLLQKRIENYFHYKGFLDTLVKFEAVYLGKGLVDITFSYEKKVRNPINQVLFKGNDKSSDMILRKLIKQMENNVGSAAKFDIAKRDIQKYGYVSKVKSQIVKDAIKKDANNVLFELKEEKTNKFSAGLSYNETNGLGINGNTELVNFLGTGYDVLFKINKTNQITDITGNYFIANFLDNSYDMNYNIYYKAEKINIKSRAYRAITSFGFAITHITNINNSAKLHLIFGGDKTFLKYPVAQDFPIVKRFIDKSGYKFKEYFFSIAYLYNSFDKPLNPDSGINSKLSFKFSIPPSNVKYFMIDYDFTIYKKVFENYLISFHTLLAYGNNYDDTAEFPFYKHFYLSGHNNVRGFKDKTLGPKDTRNQPVGGNILMSFRLCFHFDFPMPEVKKFLRPYIFLDGGQVYHSETNFSNRPDTIAKGYDYNSFLRFSMGLAIHWATPLGIPIEIAIAYPINPCEVDKIDNITISMHNKT